jgi:hypothetical protein
MGMTLLKEQNSRTWACVHQMQLQPCLQIEAKANFRKFPP